MALDVSPEAVAKVRSILEQYDARVAQITAEGRPAANMTAFSDLKAKLAPPKRHGHVPGVKPGDSFPGKGHLAILSLHSQIMRGIDNPPSNSEEYKKGAYAIVLSGGYADDDDSGLEFTYTGEGGQKDGKQVSDQDWKGGNQALRYNFETKTPVRVIRAAVVEGKKVYVYDGLYYCKSANKQASQDGPMVCKFVMEGVPGASLASAKVTFRQFQAPLERLHARVLAGAAPLTGPRPKRQRVESKDERERKAQREAIMAQIKKQHGQAIQELDITGGQEAIPIPLINEVDDEGRPACYEYVSDYVYAANVQEQVRPLMSFMDEQMRQFVNYDMNKDCGIAYNRMTQARDHALAVLPKDYEAHTIEQYNHAGLLTVTDPCGLHECGPACNSSKCKHNRVASSGVQLPLEVFKTRDKGWGVRCREDIEPGAFVCCYIGELVTDHIAEARKAMERSPGADLYLFDLDYFVHIYKEIASKGMEEVMQEIPRHKIPPVPHMLAITEEMTLAAEGADQGAARAAEQAAAEAVAAAAQQQQQDQQQQPGPADTAQRLDRAATAAAHDQQQEGVVAAAAATAATAAGGAAASGLAQPSLEAAAVGAGGMSPSPGGAADGHAAENGHAGGSGGAADAAHGGAAPSGSAAEAADGGAGPSSAVSQQQRLEQCADLYRQPLFAKQAEGVKEGEYGSPLVIDALHRGNVARFINHSCDGNLTIQAVFAKQHRNTLLYYVGLYAQKQVAAGEELTYDYGYGKTEVKGLLRGMVCNCGAATCRGNLL